jgi:hypothetical protein
LDGKIDGWTEDVAVRLFVTVTNAQEKQFKGGKIYFHSRFQSFWSKVHWLHYLEPEVKRNFMVVGP